jgi:acetyl-CoA C-acetyltransferase
VQLQALEALGLSQDIVADQRKGRFHPDGALPVNLSGGLLGQGAPAGAIGVGQTATCALALEGAYHAPLQPGASIQYALADTHGGIATNNTVTILAAGGSA